VTLEQLEQYHYIKTGAIATIGLGLQSEPKRIDFRQPDMAHLFVTGQTRSGKTNTQRLIAWNLANHCPDAQMIIFDVAKRGYKWRDFSNVASLAHPVITELGEADKVLAWGNQEIERRAHQERTTPKLFFMIDELKALLDDSKVAEPYLSRLASVGGEFGLHLVLSTQYAQIKMLGSAELKRNVTTRLCGRVDDANAAANALGIAGSGAETLQGYGDFLLKDSDGLSRLTVAKIEPSHIERLPRSETIERLPLPDDNETDNGPRRMNEQMCVEPEHAALALTNPMGIQKLRTEILDRGMADSFSTDRARRTKEFAEAQRQWILDNGPKPTKGNVGVAFNFLDQSWMELD
jgi:DNA segregation ATPase FtsK/SpoIIIE-like protein